MARAIRVIRRTVHDINDADRTRWPAVASQQAYQRQSDGARACARARPARRVTGQRSTRFLSTEAEAAAWALIADPGCRGVRMKGMVRGGSQFSPTAQHADRGRLCPPFKVRHLSCSTISSPTNAVSFLQGSFVRIVAAHTWNPASGNAINKPETEIGTSPLLMTDVPGQSGDTAVSHHILIQAALVKTHSHPGARSASVWTDRKRCTIPPTGTADEPTSRALKLLSCAARIVDLL